MRRPRGWELPTMTETSPTAPRIASVTTYGVSFPLEAPMADAVHYIPARAALLVEVGCDDGTGGALPMAISGVDIAVWDLLGQRAGLPLYRLLGGHTDRVRAYASGGFYFHGKDAAALAEEFKAAAARGYGHGKMKV